VSGQCLSVAIILNKMDFNFCVYTDSFPKFSHNLRGLSKSVLIAYHFLVNYGALMLKALFEHWSHTNVTSDEEQPSSISQVMTATRMGPIFCCV